MKTAVVVIFCLFMGALIFGSLAANDPLTIEKDSARQAIALCEKGVTDELTPMNQRRFIRATCDKMRGDYQTKYGTAP